MPYKKRASIVIFVIFLINIAIFMGWILFSESDILSSGIESQTIKSNTLRNTKEKAKLAIYYDKLMNSNGGGFTNTTSCPPISFDSWATWQSTSAVYTGSQLYCSGANLQLNYSADYQSFPSGTYSGQTVTNSSNILTFTSASVKLNPSWVLSGIDANFNSDDYSPYSSASIAYPDGSVDDDILARQTLYGYIKQGVLEYSVLWSNSHTNDYIAKNTNNSTGWILPSNASDAYISISIDGPFSARIVEFDSWAYTYANNLKVVSERTLTFSSGGSGWLGVNPDNSSYGSIYSGSLASNSGSLLHFDFQNKNFALLISYPDSGNGSISYLSYQIKATDYATGKNIYISPLDDSPSTQINYLSNDIFVTPRHTFVPRELEISESK